MKDNQTNRLIIIENKRRRLFTKNLGTITKWFFVNRNSMSEKNGGAVPIAQEFIFSDVKKCVKYLNENKDINKRLNIYLRNQLDDNKYSIIRCSENFQLFKPQFICKFVNEEKLMKLEFDGKTCQYFDEVILDFDTVYKVIQDCCEKTQDLFIRKQSQLLSFINKKMTNKFDFNKSKKISRLHCVDFIGRFYPYKSHKTLSTDFVKQLLAMTSANSKKTDKSQNVNCIAQAIDALPNEFCSDPNLLDMIFSVQNFSLFLSRPEALPRTIYFLITKSKKYIEGDQVGAIKDVLKDGELYKKFREKLEKQKKKISLDMKTFFKSNLKNILLANNLAVSIKDGKITIEEREPELDELIFLLQEYDSSLNEWIAGVTGTKLSYTYDKNIDKNQFKIDSFENIKNLKVKLIKSYIEHSGKSKTLKKVFKKLLDLEQSEPEEFNKQLNRIKLSDNAIKSVLSAIKLKNLLTGEQFNDFKNVICDLCYGVSKPVIDNIDLLSLFKERTLFSKQMETLLNLRETSKKQEIVISSNDLFLPCLLNRLKSGEALSEKLIDYFNKYSCNTKTKFECQDAKNVLCWFCNLIYQYIIHSPKYINRKDGDNGKDAIEDVLHYSDQYSSFRKNIIAAITGRIKDAKGQALKFNLEDIYKKENHIDINDEDWETKRERKRII